MKVRLTSAAEAELEEAVSWYRSISRDLCRRFLAEIRSGKERIRMHPHAWHPMGAELRRYRLTSFPYGLIYEITDSGIDVLAIAHLHREPEYWKNRVRR